MSDQNPPVNPPSSPTQQNQPSSPTQQNPPVNTPTNQNQQNPPVNTPTNQNQQVPVVIVNNTITEPGLVITDLQTNVVDVNVKTDTTFNTTDPVNHIPQITQDLKETVEYNYDDNIITESDGLTTEIRNYASLIKCESFHGKGSIDDYTALFQAASNIATESKQMQLDIDIEGFQNFGQAADDLSALFTNFTKKLQTINIIDDTAFLRAVRDALKKIYNLSTVFGKFKKTITVTSEIKVPKSVHDTKVVLTGVMDELNCAMNYIGNFVTPVDNLPNAQLSNEDKYIISKAITTIDNWGVLCEHGVTIALSNSSDIQYLTQANNELKQKTNNLRNLTSTLRTKFTNLNC